MLFDRMAVGTPTDMVMNYVWAFPSCLDTMLELMLYYYYLIRFNVHIEPLVYMALFPCCAFTPSHASS